jgi:hypothetical protein
LPWTRRQIRDWLECEHISWREDSSNQDRSHFRNAVRHELLPSLEESVPALRSHLVALAQALAEDEQYIASSLAEHIEWIDPWHPDGGIRVASVAALPAALRKRWLQAQAAHLNIGPTTRRQLELFADMLDLGSPPALTIGGRWRLRRFRSRLWIEPPRLPDVRYRFTLTDGAEHPLPIPGWSVRCVKEGQSHPQPEWAWVAQAELTVTDPVSTATESALRHRPSLSKLLAKNLPRHLRRTWPVVSVDGTISWVPGVWQHPETGKNNSVSVEVFRR